MVKTKFEWDVEKDTLNQEKHGTSFAVAEYVFADPHFVLLPKMNPIANLKSVFIVSVKLMVEF